MRAENVSLEVVEGVGKKTLLSFNKEGIYTVKDLFLTFPYRYEIYTPMSLVEASKADKACLVGRIVTPVKYQYYRAHLSSLTFSMAINEQIIKVIIFNRQYLYKILRVGSTIKISGKFNNYRKEFVASNVFVNKIQPHCEAFYKIKSLSTSTIQKTVQNALRMGARLEEYLPNFCLEKNDLLEINKMIATLHNPTDLAAIQKAQKRRKYEEILMFYLRLLHFKNLKEKQFRKAINYDINEVRSFIATIPFELTPDQKATCNAIFRDFKSNLPANRLIQGDVGSGKTIVAMIASYAMVTAHKQVVIMAPTEILAMQHYDYFRKLLTPFNVKISLFTGSVSRSNRNIILNEIKTGSSNIVIGTHALFYEKINYHNLGLAIIDEQQRFGVNARNKLLNNGEAIDAIYLSATPIPRTLALTIFSDLDISTIKTVRNNKKPIITKVIEIDHLSIVLDKLREELHKGHQAYFVTSAIDSFEEDMRFDLEEVRALLEQNFPHNSFAILHGKMKDQEKNEIMQSFLKHQIDVLISTTVIEVGISIDNATMMVVMDAQNFGLSSLHQLRGRVGRADLEGYCYLVANNADIERLNVLENSTDGFYLAEMDLKLRGPGEYFGMRQSGMSDFVFADFNNDLELFKKISQDARTLLLMADTDPIIKSYVDSVIDSLEFNDKLN